MTSSASSLSRRAQRCARDAAQVVNRITQHAAVVFKLRARTSKPLGFAVGPRIPATDRRKGC